MSDISSTISASAVDSASAALPSVASSALASTTSRPSRLSSTALGSASGGAVTSAPVGGSSGPNVAGVPGGTSGLLAVESELESLASAALDGGDPTSLARAAQSLAANPTFESLLAASPSLSSEFAEATKQLPAATARGGEGSTKMGTSWVVVLVSILTGVAAGLAVA